MFFQPATQYCSQVFDNKEHLVNINIEYLAIQFLVNTNKFWAESNHILTITNCAEVTPLFFIDKVKVSFKYLAMYMLYFR